VEFNGQTFTVNDIQVLPTHMKLNIEASQDNTSELRGLYYYVKTDNGMKFSNSGGMSGHNGYLYSVRGDSPFFYDTEPTELVITAVKWRDIPCYNITTGECTNFPDFIELVSAENDGNTLVLRFKAKAEMGDLFSTRLHDAAIYENERYDFTERVKEACGDGYTMETLTFDLNGFNHDKIYLRPMYRYDWAPAEEIVIPLQ